MKRRIGEAAISKYQTLNRHKYVPAAGRFGGNKFFGGGKIIRRYDSMKHSAFRHERVEAVGDVSSYASAISSSSSPSIFGGAQFRGVNAKEPGDILNNPRQYRRYFARARSMQRRPCAAQPPSGGLSHKLLSDQHFSVGALR